jgi:hypothetical protein
MLRVYEDHLAGPAPKFPREIEQGIDTYLATQVARKAADGEPPPAKGVIRLVPCS